jgi:hypothetical protein
MSGPSDWRRSQNEFFGAADFRNLGRPVKATIRKKMQTDLPPVVPSFPLTAMCAPFPSNRHKSEVKSSNATMAMNTINTWTFYSLSRTPPWKADVPDSCRK